MSNIGSYPAADGRVQQATGTGLKVCKFAYRLATSGSYLAADGRRHQGNRAGQLSGDGPRQRTPEDNSNKHQVRTPYAWQHIWGPNRK